MCDYLRQLKFSPSLPFAFTEHGAVMVASVLNSKRAIEISIYVVRAFVKLREMLGAHRELARKLSELERKVESHDSHIRSLFEAIRQLMEPPTPKSRALDSRPEGAPSGLAFLKVLILNVKFGRGFGAVNLTQMRRFYQLWPLIRIL